MSVTLNQLSLQNISSRSFLTGTLRGEYGSDFFTAFHCREPGFIIQQKKIFYNKILG